MKCHTCGRELQRACVLRADMPAGNQAVVCDECARVIRQIADAFGEAIAQIFRLAKSGGFQ